MSIRICGDNTTASPAITSASDTDTGLQFGTNEVKVVNGNLDITDGNLKVAAGHGIDFSATADGAGTVTSELLDDYEKGTFSPKYVTSAGGDSGISMLVGNGDYVKIGNLVYVSIQLATNDWSTGVSGDIYVDNFPFTLSTTLNNASAFNISFRREFATDKGANLTGRFINNNGTKIVFYDMATNASQGSELVHTDFMDGASENYIYGSGWYFTDA